MNVKMIMYAVFTLISALTFSAVNFNNFFKVGKVFEAKVFFLIISIISGYLITNFVIDFTGLGV